MSACTSTDHSFMCYEEDDDSHVLGSVRHMLGGAGASAIKSDVRCYRSSPDSVPELASNTSFHWWSWRVRCHYISGRLPRVPQKALRSLQLVGCLVILPVIDGTAPEVQHALHRTHLIVALIGGSVGAVSNEERKYSSRTIGN